MKFNLQMFGGGKGGSVSTYEPSDEQKALWNLQIQSAQERQPNEKYMNMQGKAFMEKVINMLNSYGAYGDIENKNNYLARGDLAISQVDSLMRKLVRVADWHTEYEADSTVQASWQTDPLVEGKNSQAVQALNVALRGTGATLGTAADGTAIIDGGFTGELGGLIIEPRKDLDNGTTRFYEFVAGNAGTGVVGINEPIDGLITLAGSAVTTANGGIDDYDGKYDSAATTAKTSANTAQGKNDNLVSGLNTSLGSYNTMQSGKANTAESLLSGLNSSNDSAVTKASSVLQPLITDTRNAATTANLKLDSVQLKSNNELTDANTALNAIYGTYDPSRQTASTILGGYRGQLDSETPSHNNTLGTLSKDVSNAYALANNELATHVAGDVIDTANANNSLISNRPNYNLASQVLENDLNDVNNDFDTQRQTTSNLLGDYRTDSKIVTSRYVEVTDSRIGYNDDNADEIYNYSKNAATDATNTASNNNADLSEYILTNKGGLSDSKADLADLKDGMLPENYLQNMEDAIKRAMTNTIGTTVNALGSRGIINSSVTTSALNDIEKNAADQLAQRYLENIKTIQSLSNDQFDHVITTDHENAEMTRQKNDIAQDALDRAFKYRQTGYEDLANNSDRNAELERRQLLASQANINQMFQLAQQDFTNFQSYANLVSQNKNATYSGKMQSAQATDNSIEQQLANSQASHNFGAQGTQNKYGNTMQGVQQRYGITNQQLSNIQANVTEGTQIAQQDFDNKMQVGQRQENNQNQQHSNSVNDFQFDAELEQNKFGNTQTGIQHAATFAQDMYGNTTNANQINANNVNSGYNIQNSAITSNWERTHTGFDAGYQNNLQAINNAQTNWSNTVNGYNSEIGLHNNIFSNSLQGINTKASLYGQQYNQYSGMINSVGNLANYRANVALNTFQQYGQWALDVYRAKMQANAADTAIYQQAISQAGLPLQFAGAAQEGAMYLPTSMWNASIGLNAPTLGAMNGLAGTGKTVVTNTGDSFWTAFGAGVAGAGVQRLVGSL